MGRAKRVDVGGEIYHVLNRANGKLTLFKTSGDYKAFEIILEDAKEKFGMRILSYEIMPNHWHLVLYPRHDSEMGLFMQWITLTHTQRWHTVHNTVGYGHLYQGRYKSFLVQKDNYFLSLMRYVESNALRAGLVKRAEYWKWSSLWRREFGTKKQKELLTTWPVDMPSSYLEWIQIVPKKADEESIEESMNKGKPLGNVNWVEKMIKKFGLESTTRKPGRPEKVSDTV